MKIKKRSGEFRGKNWCAAAREWDELKLESPKNTFYDNAIIVKEIIKGFFQGKYEISDFSDLVSQGVEDDYVTEKTGELRSLSDVWNVIVNVNSVILIFHLNRKNWR